MLTAKTMCAVEDLTQRNSPAQAKGVTKQKKSGGQARFIRSYEQVMMCLLRLVVHGTFYLSEETVRGSGPRRGTSANQHLLKREAPFL